MHTRLIENSIVVQLYLFGKIDFSRSCKTQVSCRSNHQNSLGSSISFTSLKLFSFEVVEDFESRITNSTLKSDWLDFQTTAPHRTKFWKYAPSYLVLDVNLTTHLRLCNKSLLLSD